MVNEQDIKNSLLSSVNKQAGSLGLYGLTKNSGVEVANQMSSIKKSLGEDEVVEDETTEAMGAGSAGGYSQPLFSIKKKEVEEVAV